MSEKHPEPEHEVRIHIDQEPYKSPNPTTGEALYLLGKVPHGHELYREVQGNKEDELIPRTPDKIHLKQDEHFHSQEAAKKEFTIIVNGRKKVVAKKKISFAELVALAFDPVPTGPNILITITYGKGPHANPEGTMKEGTFVRVKDGMVFNVTATDKS